MSTFSLRLELLRREGEAALQSAGNSEQLQQWHTEFLGRKGPLL